VNGIPKDVVTSSMMVTSKESSITLASPMLSMAGMSFFASMVQATSPDNSSHNCLEDNLGDCASKGVEEPNLLRGFEEGKKEAQSNRKTFRRREYFAISRRREGHPPARLSDTGSPLEAIPELEKILKKGSSLLYTPQYPGEHRQ
jgi:hypothetical protein